VSRGRQTFHQVQKKKKEEGPMGVVRAETSAMPEKSTLLLLGDARRARMEEKIAKKHGAVGNSSMSLFALSLAQKVR